MSTKQRGVTGRLPSPDPTRHNGHASEIAYCRAQHDKDRSDPERPPAILHRWGRLVSLAQNHGTYLQIRNRVETLMHAPTLDQELAERATPVTYVVRPVNTTCRYCGEPIPLFVDSAFYCCRECRDCAY